MASVIPLGKRYEGNLTTDGDDREPVELGADVDLGGVVFVFAFVFVFVVVFIFAFAFAFTGRLLPSISALANTEPKK
jgi:hypothetical protein